MNTSQLTLRKARVVFCFEIRTKHINAIWLLFRIVECWPWWYVKLLLGFRAQRLVVALCTVRIKSKNSTF